MGRNKILVLIILIVYIFLISCNNIVFHLNDTDTSTSTLLSGRENCPQFDCWEGILLDITTFEEAQSALEIIFGSENMSFTSTTIEWVTGRTDTYSEGRLWFNDSGFLTLIQIFFPENILTIENMLVEFGEPDYVGGSESFSSDVPCIGISEISFSDIGIRAELYVSADYISPLQSVQLLTIYSTSFFRDLTQVPSFGIELEWQGYIDYCSILNEP